MFHRVVRLAAVIVFLSTTVFVLHFGLRYSSVTRLFDTTHPVQRQGENLNISSAESLPLTLVREAALIREELEPEAVTVNHTVKQDNEGACDIDKACRGYLQPNDRHYYSLCLDRIKKFNPNLTARDNGCRFMNGKSRPPVALVSFPGSGNTWVRQILERVTGVCTGSDICDMSLRYEGFTGEYVRSGTVLVVKTHSRNSENWNKPRKKSYYGSAIVIVRKPTEALVSDYHRFVANGFQDRTVRLGTHTKRASKDMFGTNEKWNSYVHNHASKWKDIIKNWIIGGIKRNRKVLVVQYEDLKRNETKEVKRMLDFLEIKYPLDDLKSRMSADYRQYQRKHKPDEDFHPYTIQQKKELVRMVMSTMDELKRNNLTSVLNLEHYI